LLTKLYVKNFKRFDDVEIDLGNPVVFIGPNNSGKTTALQALALWNIGAKKWREKKGASPPKERSGVTINRRDLIAVPVPNSNLLWRNLHVRDLERTPKLRTKNVRIDIIVEGVSEGIQWKCGLEFDYANPESFYCRPLRGNNESLKRIPVPEYAAEANVAFLPPMSGLAAQETRLDIGAINVRIGEGRTAEVLRNLCYLLIGQNEDEDKKKKWEKIVDIIYNLFRVKLNPPKYLPERGEIILTYDEEQSSVTLDITAAGRGLHQVLLLLSYLYSNPNSVLLIDEPDAHLEILRQRQVYQILLEAAQEQKCQVIAASHSEVILNEAANNSTLVAFVGKPHRIDDRGSQVVKALKTISFDQYYLAESKGWVLYLEGSTDLSILKTFTNKLNHPVQEYLDAPFVHYVNNQPQKVSEHFYGLLEAKPDLVGIAIFDRLETSLNSTNNLIMTTWKKKEIENYLWYPEVLLRYIVGEGQSSLFSFEQRKVMEDCIKDLVPPLALRDETRTSSWWLNTKASEFLDALFDEYFKRIKLPNIMKKSNYHELARIIPVDMIDKEVVEKLNLIMSQAKKVKNLTF